MAKTTQKTTSTNPFFVVFVFLPFFILSYLLFQGAALPFVGYNAWNFNTYSLIAHNYNAFGFFATHFTPIISVEKNLPLRPEYYLNHPVLLSVVQAISFRLFGESFMIARLPVILASLGSMFLLFWIARIVKGIKFGIIVLFVSSLIPVAGIFGRMIGQEPLLLFFCLLTVVSILKYEQKGSRVFIYLSFISVMLGSVTDWPMVYFTCSLFLYLSRNNMKRLGAGLIASSLFMSLLYLFYAAYIQGSAAFLVEGFFNRSLGAVTKQGNWIFLWFGTILFRLFLYFSPLFVLLTFKYVIAEGRHFFLKKHFINPLYVSFLIFGFLHIFLYPEGSFGHPYWIYYLLPFIVFASSEVLYAFYLRKYYIFLLFCCLFSLIYVLLLNSWKMNEAKGNLFRFRLSQMAASQVKEYQSVLLNKNSLIDSDMLAYQFKIHASTLQRDLEIDKAKYDYILFSCWNTCDIDTKDILSLRKQFSFTEYKSSGVDLLIFSLHEKPAKNILAKKIIFFDARVPDNNGGILKKYYQYIMSTLHLPQV